MGYSSNKTIDYIAQGLIDRLQEAIDSGEQFTWVKAWKGHVTGNAISWQKDPDGYKGYSGINVFLYEGLHLTFKQMQDLQKKYPERKIRLNKGAKARWIYRAQYVKLKDDDSLDNEDDSKEEHGYFMYKAFPAYPIRDFTGIEDMFHVKQNDDEKNFDMLTADKAVEEYAAKYGITINVIPDSNKCCFRPGNRSISIPSEAAFISLEEYYCSLFHEVIHSTGLELGVDLGAGYEVEEYSREELRAEIGAQLLCSYYGVNREAVATNSVAYLMGWMKYLKGISSKDVVSIFRDASKAASLVIGENSEESAENTGSEGIETVNTGSKESATHSSAFL